MDNTNDEGFLCAKLSLFGIQIVAIIGRILMLIICIYSYVVLVDEVMRLEMELTHLYENTNAHRVALRKFIRDENARKYDCYV